LVEAHLVEVDMQQDAAIGSALHLADEDHPGLAVDLEVHQPAVV